MAFLTWSIRSVAVLLMVAAGALVFHARPIAEPAGKAPGAVASDCGASAPGLMQRALAATAAAEACAPASAGQWSMRLVYGGLYLVGLALGLLAVAKLPARAAERRRDHEELREGMLRLLG